MIKIVSKVDCCGCEACFNVCPKNCIEMKTDEEGFLYPSVNTDQCINCGLCEKVCPIIHREKEIVNKNQKGAIVACIDTIILEQSTSGGAFTPIAEYVLSKEGFVYGVEMDSNYDVHHIEVDRPEDLIKFRNSKYVQSDVGLIYKEIERKLKKGKLICFSGTPCQIEGLRHFLNKEYDNLLLVDVVCRAVPSPGVWKKYVNYLERTQGRIKDIRFRDKGLGYQYSTMKVQTEDGRVFRNGIESDSWLRMFFSGMIIRPSCTDCKFRHRYRNSDITIWDCFNVSDLSRKFVEKKGATRMLIHSKKGEQVFNDIKDKYIYEIVSPDKLVRGLTELSKSPSEHPLKNKFFVDYREMDMGTLLNKYFPNTIGIKIKKNGRLILNKLGVDIFVKKVIRVIKKG